MILHETSRGLFSMTPEDRELAIINDIAEDVKSRLNDMSETDFLDEMQVKAVEAREKLPQLAEFMGTIATHEGPRVTIVNFPESSITDIRPTPTEHLQPGELNLFAPDIYRGILVSMANWYGYGYTTQQGGVIHNNIVQVQALAKVTGHSASAPNELGLHVEDASYNLGEGKDISPDFLTLHYYRNPNLVPTIVSMPDWDELSSDSRDLLSEEWFYNRTNPAQGGEGNNPTDAVSVIYGPENEPWIRLNTAKLDLDSYTPVQQAALVEMRNYLEAKRMELKLRAGQIAIIDNRRVLHGRPAFKPNEQPQYDGTDRWQRRLVVANDASRIQQHEAAYRIVEPERVL